MRHEIGTSDAYRGELFRILLGLTALRTILSCHDVKKGWMIIGCNGSPPMRSAQDHNRYHPIEKSNANLQKGIMTMRESLLKTNGISIMWEAIAGYWDNEVNWDQLTPMELTNCKFVAVAKNIFDLSVDNNWKPINRFPSEGCHCMVVPLKILGFLSKVVTEHI